MYSFLEGQIPDAALIHAARKRRQQARDLGEDFIPISSSQSKRYFHKLLFYTLSMCLALMMVTLCLKYIFVTV